MFWTITADLCSGFVVTFLLFLFTLVLALPLGLVFAFCTMSKFAPLRILFKVIVWILRGTPLLLQLFAMYYVPGLLTKGMFVWPTINTGWAWFDATINKQFLVALVAFSINYAAYFSEIYRGGIESISKGQYEAGEVLGMTKRQIFSKVVLMQVIKRVLPPMSNETITLVKDTALANTLGGLLELTFHGNYYMVVEGAVWAIFYAGAFYLIFNGLLTLLFGWLEKKLSYYKV